VHFTASILSFSIDRVRRTNGIGMSIPLMKSKLTTTAAAAGRSRRCDRNNPNSYRHIPSIPADSGRPTANLSNVISSSRRHHLLRYQLPPGC